MSDPGVDAGQVGGIFAGVVAAMVALGQGVKWLLNFRERQADSRAVKLQAWHEELQAREKRLDQQQAEYQERIEKRLTIVTRQNMALRMAFEMVAAPLRRIDPANRELAQAEQLLTAAFPLDPDVPAEIGVLLGAIERADAAG